MNMIPSSTAEHYIAVAKDNALIQELLEAWKLDRVTGGGDLAIRMRVRLLTEESADAALAFFVSLSEQALDDSEQLAIAEEMEWFLEKHGVAYWGALNELCVRLPQFRAVIASVWGASLSKDLKRRIEMWRS